MFRSLRIRNFKAWKDTGPIRLAPITVFFGSNSSGKSSILQFLLMLRQTAESPDRRRVLHPGDRNTPVELGTYRDLVFRHDLDQEIQFDFEWTLPEPLTIRDPISRESVTGRNVAFRAQIASDGKGADQHVRRIEYELQNSGALIARMKTSEERGRRKYKLEAEHYKLVRNQGRAWPLPQPVRFYGFPEETGFYYQNAGFTSELALALEQQLKRIQYLGPLRTDPERSYVWSGEVPEHVGWRGERSVEAMLAAGSRTIHPAYRLKGLPFQAVVAKWLTRVGLLDEFEVRAIAQNRKEFEVVVRTRGSRDHVTLPDVGFGVSQVLPVIVECFYAAPHTTILLEQPEIHLHPRVQTELADLFVETVQSRENQKDRMIQLIIESHSEHFLRRLQRRIAEGSTKPEDVALYFCEPGEQGSILRPLEVNLFGDIAHWPDDFFGDEMSELAARMDAAAKKEASVR